jgi:hypothetical protein
VPAVQDGVWPDLILTRTVPGLEPRSVRSRGAPFPLARARALVVAAPTVEPPGPADLRARLEAGIAWLQPAQVGRSQLVQLRLEPDGRDVLALLTGG